MMQHQEPWNSAGLGLRPTKSAPCSPIKPAPTSMLRTHSDSFHVAHKVPVGDTPYVRAKRVQVRACVCFSSDDFRSQAIGFDLIQLDLRMQLVDKDPEKAIALFWAAINAGDRVDSALKDMAIVMKQQNRAQEAIEAIKSLRSRCSDQAQESLDNILLDLYKVHSSPSSFFASPASIETSCTRINRKLCPVQLLYPKLVLNLGSFLFLQCTEMRAIG
jgi:hypothetical protein